MRTTVSADQLRDGVRAATARSWQVRKRLKVPDRTEVHPTVLGDQSLAPDDRIAARAADTVLLICDDWPCSERDTAALIIAADRAGGRGRPVTALYDPRLTGWIADHLEDGHP